MKENLLKKFWEFLKKDTWQSWTVSLILLVAVIRFVLFPTLSLVTGSSLPLVVVESCSMYHEMSFEEWWFRYNELYEPYEITKSEFEEFSLKSGLNKGDIIFVWGRSEYEKGDIIIFPTRETMHPVIHRMVIENPIMTKGDNGQTNPTSASFERDIPRESIIGKAVFKVPLLGWIKLAFFDPFKPSGQRGFC